MKIIKMTQGCECPKKGDLVLIQGTITRDKVVPYRIAEIKVAEETFEIILNKRRNVWFGWSRYLAGTSWVTDCQLVLP